MGRRGPKPGAKKKGLLDPSLTSRLVQADAVRLAETVIVMKQPHRRFSADPQSEWNGTVVGRFLLPMRMVGGKEDPKIRGMYEAADSYREQYRAWWRARGCPDVVRESRSAPFGSGSVGDPADDHSRDDEIRALGERLHRIKIKITTASYSGFMAIRNAIMFESEIPFGVLGDAMTALEVLAVEMGKSARAHPFHGDE